MTVKKWLKEYCLPAWVVSKLKPAQKAIAFTFDDGPHPEFTPKVLDVLKKYDAKASFFLVGDNIKKYPELVERMVSEGHCIANHSMTHAEFASIPLKSIFNEIDRCDELIRPYVGERSILLRTPKGVLNLRVLWYCLLRLRKVYLWSQDPEDFIAHEPQQIYDRFEASPIKKQDIILMHDKSQVTVDALDKLIQEARSRGLDLITLGND